MSRLSARSIVKRHATQEGVTATGIPGVQLYRISGPIERTPAIYTPRICFNTSGAKRVFSNGKTHTYDDRHFICCTMPVPVESDVPKATSREPVLGVSLEFDAILLRELIAAISATRGCDSDSASGAAMPEGLAVGIVSEELADAMLRLLELIDDPTSKRALAQSRLTEVYFVLLTSPLGPVLRRRFGETHKIAETVCYLRDHINEQLTIDQLARWSGMSRAAFHRNFKKATGMAPIQFIKQFRLNTAAMQLAAGMRTGEVAASVGYNSQSQFSREFKRQFGQAPRDWASSSSA